MRNSAFVVATTVLVSLVGVSQARYYETPNEVVPFSIIDPIIKAILEGMRPKLANLKVKDIDQSINQPNLNATILVNDILIKNLDKFVIRNLKSNVVPLKLTNLTLTWNEIIGSANYDVKGSIGQPGPLNFFGKGNAEVTLERVFLTVGANVEMKDKAIQVKPKGLFGFDIYVGAAKVTLSSIMGKPELGKIVGDFISQIIPELVDTLKKPVFDAFHDDIVNVINQILKNNPKSFFLDEEPEFSLNNLDLSDSSEEFDFDF